MAHFVPGQNFPLWLPAFYSNLRHVISQKIEKLQYFLVIIGHLPKILLKTMGGGFYPEMVSRTKCSWDFISSNLAKVLAKILEISQKYFQPRRISPPPHLNSRSEAVFGAFRTRRKCSTMVTDVLLTSCQHE